MLFQKLFQSISLQISLIISVKALLIFNAKNCRQFFQRPSLLLLAQVSLLLLLIERVRRIPWVLSVSSSLRPSGRLYKIQGALRPLLE